MSDSNSDNSTCNNSVVNGRDYIDDYGEVPTWPNYKRKILRRNGNLKEGALTYIGTIEESSLLRICYESFLKEIVTEFHDDGEVVLAVCRLLMFYGEFEFTLLEDASTRLQDDEGFVIEMVDIFEGNLMYASPRLKADKAFILKAMDIYVPCLRYASPSLKADKAFILQVVEIDGLCLRYASPGLKADKTFILQAVEIDGRCLLWADSIFHSDEEVVSKACQDLYAFDFIKDLPASLSGSVVFMLHVVAKCGPFLEYATANLRSDKTVVSVAIKSSPQTLEFASPQLLDDKEFMLEILQDGYFTRRDLSPADAFQHASPRLRNDKQLVMTVVKHTGIALQYASPDLRNDIQVAMEAVNEDGRALRYVSPALRNDRQVVLEAVNKWGMALQFASPDLQNDRQVATEAVNENGAALRYASPAVRNDRHVVLGAVTQDGTALIYASPDLQNDRHVVTEAVSQDGNALQYSSPDRQNDRQVVSAAVNQYGGALQYASPGLRNDFRIVLAAVRKSYYAIWYASRPLRMNIEIRVRAEMPCDLPETDVLRNQDLTPPSVFPYLLERVNQNPLVGYYCLRSRPDLIPRGCGSAGDEPRYDKVSLTNKKRKRSTSDKP